MAGMLLVAALVASFVGPAAAARHASAVCELHRAGTVYRGTCGRIFDDVPVFALARGGGIQSGLWRKDWKPAEVWSGTLTEPGGSPDELEMELDAARHGIIRTPYGWFAVSEVSGGAGTDAVFRFRIDVAHEVPPSDLDLEILKRAAAIISSDAVWNRADDRRCSPDARTWSIYCAVARATAEVTGGFHHRRPAMELVREIIDERTKGRDYHHRMMDYNNDPATTLADVRSLFAQATARAQRASSQSADHENGDGDKRIWGIIPNYRTSPTLENYRRLTPAEKWKLTEDDAFDRGTFMLGAAFAGEAQLRNATPAFGHGLGAYARYFAASTTDFIVGDVMTEGLYPVLLREDPRYFRLGSGGGGVRLGSAVGQIFWTHTDSGGSQFNYSEVVGNATAVALANIYYPDNRRLSSDVSKLGIQIAVDMVANIVKEFSPDLDRIVTRRRRRSESER